MVNSFISFLGMNKKYNKSSNWW